MPAGKNRLVAIGAVAGMLLLVAGGSWALTRPRPNPPSPTPRATASRGFPPTLDLPAVVDGTVAGTDSIQVGHFSRSEQGAVRAAHSYLWALAGSDEKGPLLERIAAPGGSASIAASLESEKNLLTQQFLLGFRTVEPRMERYDKREPVITVSLVGNAFKVRLRWVDDTSGGDWKLVSVDKDEAGAPIPEPTPS